eukprot:8932069-Karenia_brevis.AAC.1
MQQYVSDGEGGTKLRACCLEPSRREFAGRDLHAQPHSQFGPRVHVDPKSQGVGWGVPRSSVGGQHTIGQMGAQQEGLQMAT